jgi:hypothetical protein
VGLVGFLAAFALLGRWQWNVAGSLTGSLQNRIYAFQWWSFGVAFLYFWWWMIREEFRDRDGDERAEPEPPAVVFDDEDWIALTLRRHHLLPPPDDATRAEVSDYRRYLADLYAADQAREQQAARA